jgi:hypothetical protein
MLALFARMRAHTQASGALQLRFKELLESWRAAAAAPRSARELAVRLPLDDAARLAALAEMYPGRTPEQLTTELLAAALAEVAAAMPYVAGDRVIATDEQGDPVYEDVGPTPRFMELVRAHRARLEAVPAARAAPARGKRPAAPKGANRGARRRRAPRGR